MVEKDEIYLAAVNCVKALFEQYGVGHKFPPDVVWSASKAGEIIPQGSKGSLPRRLQKDGYLKATGGVARAQKASRRGSKLTEYTFGWQFTGEPQPTELELAHAEESFVLEAIAALEDAGLVIQASTTARFLAALATKPFCILTGLAGSGKTKLAEALAMWLSESPVQYKLVAVGADWTNNEQLLGYADALHGALYRKPANGALDLILTAVANPSKPHFLILDEMNLSHVERYFADVLSAIESRNAALALHSHVEALPSVTGGAADVPAELALPRNLFIIGTVNVDETTYMFSPKVLDRANVIEFRATAAQLGAFLDDPRRLQLDALSGGGAAYGEGLVHLAAQEVDVAALGDADSTTLKVALLEVFGVLAEQGAEFGFRSAYEMARFVVIHKQLCESDWTLADALDAQVLQKLMPRLHGSARKLDKVLADLDAFCVKHALPSSREKIARMQRRLQADGFASFAEN